MTSSIRAIQVAESEGRARGALVRIAAAERDTVAAGGVAIRTVHSGINYKDALAVSGRAPIAAFGNAGGHAFGGSVLPFILRGVQLIGINANSPMPLRETVWARIAGGLRPRGLDAIARVIRLDDVLDVCERQVRGETRGRAIIGFH